MQKPPRVFFGERWKIEKTSDVIHIEEMDLVGSPRHAHRNDGNTREVRIAFPRLQWNRSEQIVLAEHDVGALLAGGFDCVGDPHDAGGLDA